VRTVQFLVAGFLLLAAALLLARLFSETYAGAARLAIGAFIVAWLVITGANMWAGITKAGYSFGEELPIFLLLFLVPTAAAMAALFLKARWLAAA
jgi:hypothetical protein